MADFWVEGVSFGHAVFHERRGKLCVVTTSHHNGLYRNGIGITEPLPRHLWLIHWTKTCMPVDEVLAVHEFLKGLPDGG